MSERETPKSGHGQSHLTVDAAYVRAIEHFNAGRYQEADQLCTSIIQAAPNHLHAINLLGVIAQKVNHHDQAAGLFQKAIAIDGSISQLYLNLGISLNQLGRKKEAVATLQDALAKDPANDRIAGYLNGIINSPAPPAAVDGLPGRTEADPLQTAISCHQSGQLEDAIKWYQKSLETDPDNHVALSNMGFAQLSVGTPSAAIESCRKALNLKPDYAQAHSNLGAALQQEGVLDAAIDCFEKAVSLKPDYADAYSNLGNVLLQQGRLDEAVVSFKKAISINPNHARAYASLGNAMSKSGGFDEVAAYFQKAIAIQPDYPEAHYDFGIFLSENGLTDAAISCFTQTIKLKADHTDAYINLGNALSEQNRLDEAVATLRQAITIKPDFAQLHYNLGNILKELRDPDQAVLSYQKAITIQPDHAEAHMNCGKVLQKQGKLDAALKQYNAAISIKPEKDGWRIRRALSLPIIPGSAADLQDKRAKLIAGLAAMQKQKLSVADPVTDIGMANFHLAYHNQNNRTILEDIARLHVSASPMLTYAAEHCQTTQPSHDRLLRIGFLSAYLNRHTVAEH